MMDKPIYELAFQHEPLLPFVFHKELTIYKNDLLNWHQNIEILFAISGTGYVKYDKDLYPFHPGDIIIVNSYFTHMIIPETKLVYRCLIIDRSFCEANGIFTTDLHFQERIHDMDLAEKFEDITKAFSEHQRKNTPFTATNIRYQILGLLCQICHKYIADNETTISSLSQQRIKKAFAYIQAHSSESLTLQGISDYVGVSKFYLSREFKLYTDMTLFDALNQIRCVKAKKLIEQGISVSEAALSCGFENLSYFSRTFKKHIGTLPSKCASSKK